MFETRRAQTLIRNLFFLFSGIPMFPNRVYRFRVMSLAAAADFPADIVSRSFVKPANVSHQLRSSRWLTQYVV